MEKKVLALFLMIMMLSALMPQAALAADHTVADGETLNIETGVLTHADSTTETLTVSDGDTVSVDAGAEATITGSKNVKISCGAGVTLTLDNVTSDVGYSECALSFTGGGNTLTLAGTNTLESGHGEPGVRVDGTTALEIAGNGSLDVTGGRYAAGVGGTIQIGGNACVTATGGTGDENSGGPGAGIGGGSYGSGGTINISGGAAVFLGTDTISPSPATATHTHYTFTEDTEEAYGIAVPPEWEPTFGAYLVLCDLEYHTNGGSGTPPPSLTDRAGGASATVADGSGLSFDGFGFGGWNTAADGSARLRRNPVYKMAPTHRQHDAVRAVGIAVCAAL